MSKQSNAMYKKLLIGIVILTFIGNVFAQSGQVDLESNYLSARINNSGSLFWDQIGSARYRIPKGVNVSPIFMSSLWMGGLNSDGEKILAAQTYRQFGQNEYGAGPVTNSNTSTVYDKVWLVTKRDIDNHIKSPDNGSEAILNWPAHGDTLNGEAFYLAPFVDENENGIYEPLLGDYPKIQGTHAAYFIMSELKEKAFSNTENGKFEIHCMAYLDDKDTSAAVASTLFLKYKIYNRSNNDYTNFHLGVWNDYDLGYGFDDLLGFNTNLNASYVYNGDGFDEGIAGYGSLLPAFGCVFLNKETKSHNVSGLTPFLTSFDADDIYDALTANEIELGGSVLKQTGERDGNPGDRKSISTIEIGTFKASSSVCFNMAYVFANSGISNDSVASIPVLFSNIRRVQDYYNRNQGSCFDVYSSLAKVDRKAKSSIRLMNEKVYAEGFSHNSTLNIYNLSGQLIYNSIINDKGATIPANQLDGVYIIEVLDSKDYMNSLRQKVFVQ